MKLENQVVSLELSKKLKELGVEQESLFTWMWSDYRVGGRQTNGENGVEFKGGKMKSNYKSACVVKMEDWMKDDDGVFHDHNVEQRFYLSAFTVAELGEMLPWYFSSEKHSNDYRAGFANAKGGKWEKLPIFCADTEADARAKMLIYLLENKLVS